MAENKTKKRKASVEEFLKKKVKDPARRADCDTLVQMMSKATGEEPKMWGPSIVGFGDYHYVYESGREGDVCQVGFSPRDREFSIYLMGGLGQHEASLAKLGPHRRGGGCLYIKRLEELNLAVLRKMIGDSVKGLKRAKK